MSHITTLQLSEMAGITKRHCQRLLVAGEVPDAVRTSGGHWSIPDNTKVRKWSAKQKNGKHERKLSAAYSDPAMVKEKANQINGLDAKYLSSINGAKTALEKALMACVEIGLLITQISKKERAAWLRENLPHINQKQIAAYLSIANTYKRRKHSAIDHSFLKLLEIAGGHNTSKNAPKK
jgi:hypothetical protein